MRAAIERQAQALQAQVPQAPPPQAPQMVPPLCQPLPSSGSQPATPYQQVVQLPHKPKGRGVTFDSSTDKLPAMGSQDTDGREPKAKMITPGLPGEHMRGPLLGWPVSRCCARGVSAPLGHLVMSPQPQDL